VANDVKVDVTLDTKGGEKDAEGFKAKMSSVFGDMGKIAGGIFMAQVGSQLAGAGVDTLKSSITLARDFNEIQSKSNTIFGESAAAINKWASTASTGFGQSKAQALDAASSFGNMFSQLGIGSKTAADMSVKMTELASDFASFHNADITEVLQAQQAAFRGEYDALQKFVPTINAAAVQQEAMAETGKTNAASLTQQEKAAATYTLMLKGAGDAQGDFDRTSSSLANQQRILSAQWADLQVKIGQVLIPALTAVVVAINTEVIPAVKDFAVKVQTYYEQNIKPAIENLKALFNTLEPVIRPILEAVANHIKNVAVVFGDVVNLILALVSGDWGKAWEMAKKLVSDMVQLVKDDLSGMIDFITGLAGLAKTAGSALGGAIADGISAGFDWIIGHVTGLINGLISAYNNTLGRVPGAPSISPIGGGGGGSSTGYDPNQRGSSGGGADPGQLSQNESMAGSPTGAYGQGLVWDPSANRGKGAWVYPWDSAAYNANSAAGLGGGLARDVSEMAGSGGNQGGSDGIIRDGLGHWWNSATQSWWNDSGGEYNPDYPTGKYQNRSGSHDVIDIRSGTGAVSNIVDAVQGLFVFNVQNLNASSEDQARQAAGDLAYAVRSAGLAMP